MAPLHEASLTVLLFHASFIQLINPQSSAKYVDEYLELSRMSRREETLRLEVERLRNSFSFQFGNLFVQAIERPITLPLLPFKVLAFLIKSAKQQRRPEKEVKKITRNCIVGYSADSPRSVHFDRMEVILRELRSQGIQTVHVTNDRSACLLNTLNSHSIYTIPPRSHFNDMVPRTWNKKLEQIFSGILDTFHPRTMIFDGDYPFRGILNAITLRPEMNRFWVRESLLNFKISSLPVDAFDEFDAIIHPSLSRRDDPDTIIGQSGTIFCNPIMGLSRTREFLDSQKAKMDLENKTIVFVQLNASIKNIEEIFETLLLKKSVQILTMHTKIPQRFVQHANVTTYHHLSTEEAVQIADICFISPDFFNIYSCLGNKKPTMCIVESPQHLDSMAREFGTKKLPIILIEGECDSKFISDGIVRLQDPDYQQQLTQRIDELNLQDGTPELCNYITELHEINQIKVDSTD